MSTPGFLPKLCQITRCARNRHSGPRAGIQGGGAFVCCPSKTVSLPNSLPPCPTLNLPPSPCVRHTALPTSPARPNAHPGRTPSHTPGPFAPGTPKIASPSRSTHSRPCPIQPHTRPSPSPRLLHFSPPIRPNPAIFATPLEIYAHPYYHRPREGPTPRPGNPTPKRGRAPSIL